MQAATAVQPAALPAEIGTTMSNTPPLFSDWAPPNLDVCRGRNHGSETSAAAHARILPHKRAVYRQVLDLVRASGSTGCTLHELAEALDIAPHSLSPRLTELRGGGFLAHARDADGNKIKRRGAAALVAVEEVLTRHG